MPLQRAVERDALADEPFAVIDQQPQIELGPIQMRDREGLQALPATRRERHRGRRSDRTCRADARSCERRPSDASGSATPARRGRSETAPGPRRRAGSPQAPRPARHQGRAPTATAHRTRAGRPGRSARPATRRSRPRPPRPCANACECPRQARSCPSSSSSPRWTDAWRTRLAGGGATHLSSHARHPRPATSDTTGRKSDHRSGRQPQRESARRPVGTFSTSSDITDDPNHNSKPRRGSTRPA